MRKNPSISKASPPREDGIELPRIIGIDQNVLKDAEKMPDVSMKSNDGDNPSVASASFATGKDMRNRSGATSHSNPTPAKPGA